MTFALSATCSDGEGWGPFSPTRAFDFSLCFENVAFNAFIALLAAAFACVRILVLRRHYAFHKSTGSASASDRLGPRDYVLVAAKLTLSAGYVAASAFANFGPGGALADASNAAFVLTVLGVAVAAVLTVAECALARDRSVALAAFWVVVALANAITLRSLHELSRPLQPTAAAAARRRRAGRRRGDPILPAPPSAAQEKSGPVATVAMAWIWALLFKNARTPLQESDVWPVRADLEARLTTAVFDQVWGGERAAAAAGVGAGRNAGKVKPSLTRALVKGYAAEMALPFVLGTVSVFLEYCQPLLLATFLNLFTDSGVDVRVAVTVAAAMAGVTAFANLTAIWAEQASTRLGFSIRSGVSGAIYRKSLSLSWSSRDAWGPGEISNLISSDTATMLSWHASILSVWLMVLKIAIGALVLYTQLRWPAIVGIGYLLAMSPVQINLGSRLKSWMTAFRGAKGARLRLMNEILAGIKIIKMSALENVFIKRMNALYQTEMKAFSKLAFNSVAMAAFGGLVPTVAFLITLTLYIVVPGFPALTPATVFAALSTFSLIGSPLSQITQDLNTLMGGIASIVRIAEFLLCEELRDDEEEPSDSTGVGDASAGDKDLAIVVKNGSFAWTVGNKPPTEKKPSGPGGAGGASGGGGPGRKPGAGPQKENEKEKEKPIELTPLRKPYTLTDVNLSIRAGTLTAIVGPTGQGKSTLLTALLRQTDVATATPVLKGAVAYASQKPWIFNGTVRENILFNLPFDAAWYARVLDACALRADLAQLAAGDATELGSKGGTLSGGQKARIALARAAYRRASVYLLDDPLSALDAHVARTVFDRVIGPRGLLAGATRVLVTHAVKFVPYCDAAVLVDNGRLVEQAALPDGLSAATHPRLFALIEPHRAAVAAAAAARDDADGVEVEDEGSAPADGGADEPQTVALIMKEDTSYRSSSAWEFLLFLKSAGAAIVLGFFLLNLTTAAVDLGGRYWLASWSNAASSQEGQPHSSAFYLGIYVALSLGHVATGIVETYVWQGVLRVKSSYNIHADLLKNVIHLPMGFFDTNPPGRILNRFAQDLWTTTMNLSLSMLLFINNAESILLAVIPAVINSPFVLLGFVPAAFVFVIVTRFYIPVERFLERVGSAKRSPILDNLIESIDGIAIIRATRSRDAFVARHIRFMNEEQSVTYLTMMLEKWTSLFNRTMATLLFFLIAVVSIVSARDSSAAAIGLSLSYIVGITETLSYFFSVISRLAVSLTSFERILRYTRLPGEDLDAGGAVPPRWPDRGAVEFVRFSARYPSAQTDALDELTFAIAPGEKVGVVGRTGAGKSSVALALLRVLEARPPPADAAADGSPCAIRIDGIDIATVRLRDLRGRLAVVPQDPVLFEGSVRANLVPDEDAEGGGGRSRLRRRDDAQLWGVLEAVGLKDHVSGLEGKLDAAVGVGGEKLSAGQRQLVCVARALLRGARVVVLDEATASVDDASDGAVQAALRSSLSECTVLTIAHRVHTVADSDKILVLDAGRVKEFAPPEELMAVEGSMFKSLLDESNRA
ncbi:hypothetical protein DFJ73DRAFT_897188 [Zopfochytrium polystomum]|nr:hypothetical protein DFJ73DRAFT_897188 [Zopfochytrium polystomum]